MADKMVEYVSWRILATAACIIVFTIAGFLWSSISDRIKVLEGKMEQKVDYKVYEADITRIEKKLDQLINMHMAGTPYRRMEK